MKFRVLHSDPFFGLHRSGCRTRLRHFFSCSSVAAEICSRLGLWPQFVLRLDLFFLQPAHRQDLIPALDRFRCQTFFFLFTFLLRSDKTGPKSSHGQQHFFIPVLLPPVRSGSPFSFSRHRLGLTIHHFDSSPGRMVAD
jgi:hypothetical protein